MRRWWLLAALAIAPHAALAQQAPVPEISDPNQPPPLVVRVGGATARLEHYADVRYARVAIAHPLPVEITAPAPIQNARIYPSRLGLTATVRGRVLKFTLAQVRDVAIQVDRYEPLYFFADTDIVRLSQRVRRAKPPREPGRSVLEFGADPSGRRLSTRAFQNAIDSLAGHGDTLRVPAGTFRTGGLRIAGAMTLLLQPGARIQASSDPADYPIPAGAVEPGSDVGTRGTRLSYTQLIHVTGASDVNIVGRGTIDGAGEALRALGRRTILLRIQDSRRVRVEGVILRDPAGWNSHVLRSEDVTFHRVRLLSDRTQLNNDGIDPDGSKRVTIDSCFIDTGDDAVAIKSTGHAGAPTDVGDIVIRDCLLRTRKSAMKVGTESRCSLMQGILFARNDIIEADRAISLYCRDQAKFSGLAFDDDWVEGWLPNAAAQIIEAEVRPRDGPPGSIENVVIRNLRVAAPAPAPSSLRGLDADHPIADVRFEYLTVGDRVCRSAADVPLKTNAYVRGVSFVTVAPR
jgi:hypothetical protein